MSVVVRTEIEEPLVSMHIYVMVAPTIAVQREAHSPPHSCLPTFYVPAHSCDFSPVFLELIRIALKSICISCRNLIKHLLGVSDIEPPRGLIVVLSAIRPRHTFLGDCGMPHSLARARFATPNAVLKYEESTEGSTKKNMRNFIYPRDQKRNGSHCCGRNPRDQNRNGSHCCGRNPQRPKSQRFALLRSQPPATKIATVRIKAPPVRHSTAAPQSVSTLA